MDEDNLPIDTEFVKDTLDEIWKNRSTIILTHRLSTLKNVDVIYVLKVILIVCLPNSCLIFFIIFIGRQCGRSWNS